MKKLLLLLLCLTKIFALTKSDIVGKWTNNTITDGPVLSEYYQFHKDGSCYFNMMKEEGKGTWSLNGNRLHFSVMLVSLSERGLDSSLWKSSWKLNKVTSNQYTHPVYFNDGTRGDDAKLYKVPLQYELSLDSNWNTVDIIAGDLTGDGIIDIVRIIEDSRIDARANIRVLEIYKGTPKGHYKLLLKNKHAILHSDEGGVWGDPFDGLTYKRNSLFINFYGGSRYRWSYSYQFLKRKKALSLVGEEQEQLDIHTNDITKTSINYLSGKTLIKKGKEDGTLSERWETQGKKPLIPLKDFTIKEMLK